MKKLKRSIDDLNQNSQEDRFIMAYNKYTNNPIKVLLCFYKPHYFQFILSSIFYILKHVCVWVLPIVTANVINIAIDGGDDGVQRIILNIVVISVLVVFNFPMNYLHTKCRSRAIRSVESGLRGALVKKLQQLSISYHTDIESGRLQSKVMRDVEAVETLSSQLFVSLLNIALNLVVALSVTLAKSRIVFIFFLVCVPIAAYTIVIFRDKIKTRNYEFRKEMEETSSKVMEMVELIPITRAHALENLEIRKMTSQLHKVANKGYLLDMVQANFSAISWGVFQLSQIVCLGFTGYLALKGSIAIGDITLYQTYFSTVVNQVSNLITLLPIISKGTESVSSIGEILRADDVEDNKGKIKLDNLKGEFEFKDVHFSYKESEKEVISGLNLKVLAGETIALVGESGAGKSTILNMIIGFIKATSGELLIDGCDIKDIDLHSYRSNIAVVPQNSILFSGSIRDNITYGMRHVDEVMLRNAIKAANLESLIKSLPEGWNTVIGEHGGKLSGGQRQRISIARAIIRNPKVIILDEATSALDSISEREIQVALNNLTKDRTTFIVAHRLSTIRDADKIAVLNNGVCNEYGTFEQLMKQKGEFYQMRKLQA